MLSPQFIHSTKNNLFLNLLYRVLRHCKEQEVVYGLIKRVLQCCLSMNVGMCCGLLFMVSTVMRERGDVVVKGELKTLMENGVFEKVMEEETKKEEEKKEEVKEKEEKEVEKEVKKEEVMEEEEEKMEEGDDEVMDLNESFFEDQDKKKKEEEAKEEEKEESNEEEEEAKPEEKEEEKTPLSN